MTSFVCRRLIWAHILNLDSSYTLFVCMHDSSLSRIALAGIAQHIPIC